MAAASGQSERPIATALLLLGNLIAVQFAPYLLFAINPRGISQLFWMIGVLAGQCVWLAFWFSMSQLRLRYRVTALLVTVPIANAVYQYGWIMAPWYWFRVPRELLLEHLANSRLWSATVMGTGFCLSFVLVMYAILLPIRRLRGISLGRRPPDAAARHNRQFTVRDWMIWSAVGGLSIAIFRWTVPDDRFLLMLYFGSVVAAVAVLIGAAFFSASLCGYRSLVAMPLALAFVLAVAWLGTEGAYQLPGFPASGPPIEFRMAIAVITSAWIAIGLNNLMLRCFGVRLHVARRQPQAERVPA